MPFIIKKISLRSHSNFCSKRFCPLVSILPPGIRCCSEDYPLPFAVTLFCSFLYYLLTGYFYFRHNFTVNEETLSRISSVMQLVDCNRAAHLLRLASFVSTSTFLTETYNHVLHLCA
jgi:hypothetical protein